MGSTRLSTHSKQYTSPPFGPKPNSCITSWRLTRSLMSIAGSYWNDSAAGSRLTRCPVRLDACRWVMNDAANVDLPAPAGPVTSTAYLIVGCAETVLAVLNSAYNVQTTDLPRDNRSWHRGRPPHPRAGHPRVTTSGWIVCRTTPP